MQPTSNGPRCVPKKRGTKKSCRCVTSGPILTQIDCANAPIWGANVPIWVQFWDCQYYQLYHHPYIPNNFLYVLVLEMVTVSCTKVYHMVHPPRSPLHPWPRREVSEHTMPSRVPCIQYTLGRVVLRDG